MKWIAFMKLGKHTDSKGRPFEATSEVLDKIVAMNQGREAPIAIGHPETDSPAWGWVNVFKRVGDVLYAGVKEVVKDFEGWVQEGRWKNVSVAMNPDLTIRHLGFLGATPPAVEGLPGVKFAAADGDLLFQFAAAAGETIEFSNHKPKEKEEHVMKKLFALLGLTETATEDDAIAAVNAVKATAGTIVANKAVLGALELKPEATEADVVGLITLMKQSHTAVADLRTENAKLEKTIRDGEAEDVVRFARSKGKITRDQETWAMEYAKRDIDGFRQFVNKAPVVLDPDLTDQGGPKFVSPGSDVDMDTVQAIATKAIEFQAAAEKTGRTITISEAVNSVIKKKK